jgi:hypothetical protein
MSIRTIYLDRNRVVLNPSPQECAAREVVKLIRKLRWIGLETEARELQAVLGEFPSEIRESPLAAPQGTD